MNVDNSKMNSKPKVNETEIKIKRIQVKDDEGKTAYVDSDKIVPMPYIITKATNAEMEKIKNNPYKERIYIKRDVIASNDKNPEIIVDQYGTLASKKISETTLYEACPFDGYQKSFAPDDFGLSSESHYSRCGAVPKRIHYSALDAFEEDGDYCQDMFFTTARSKYVI